MQIERRTALHPDEFIGTYLSRNRPVIVTDAMQSWNMQGLASVTALANEFGELPVQIYDDLFALLSVGRLKDYLARHWRDERSPSGAVVPYVRWYSKFKPVDFCWADAAFERIRTLWSMPYFLPSTGYELPHCRAPETVCPSRDAFPAKGIFISPAGARTRLHKDPWHSDAVLCQVMGRKRVRLYGPDAGCNPDAEGGPAVPRGPAQCEDFLEANEVLFIPSDWPHEVDTEIGSVSLTWNFVHSSHSREFRHYLTGGVSAEDLAVLRFFSCAVD